MLITSAARVEELEAAPENAVRTDIDGLRVDARMSGDQKCVRCWHRRPDVGANAAHPQLCGRCVINVDGPGEERRFA